MEDHISGSYKKKLVKIARVSTLNTGNRKFIHRKNGGVRECKIKLVAEHDYS